MPHTLDNPFWTALRELHGAFAQGAGEVLHYPPDIAPFVADAHGLTALMYPHYFRARTMALGRYFGIYLPDATGRTRLAAMIGERLGGAGYREQSAICTHPEFTGLGLARRLTAWLANRLQDQGLQPLLHVSHGNLRARALYRGMGFRTRRDLPLWRIGRA